MRTRLTELLGIEVPVVQAPMAGFCGADLVVAVAEAGGLGSLPCVMLAPDGVRDEMGSFRERSTRPVNLNFFCHANPDADEARMSAWLDRLRPYYAELGVEPPGSGGAPRMAFDETMCAVVEELRPEVVSFHFGLPAAELLARVHGAGATVLSSATTVAEARWLVEHGCDAVIAQGAEAGGHRGMFLGENVATQVGTMALVPQVVDAVDVPVIAAGGIADGRGVAAALALGASGVQMGTAFLRCPEALTGALHREALAQSTDDATALTNVMTGRPARSIVNRMIAELGPLSADAPAFPLAAGPAGPLRAAAETRGSDQFSPLWSGQSGALGRELPAGELVARVVTEAEQILQRLAGDP